MKLEDQVCSVELAKKLKELGVKQESLVFWLNIPDVVHMKLNADGTIYFDENGSTVVDRIDHRVELGNPIAWNVDYNNRWSAFTVAELGEMLPWYIEIDDKTYWYGTGKTRKLNKYYREHEVHYSDGETTPCLEREETEANARAKMLICLIENNLIKP